MRYTLKDVGLPYKHILRGRTQVGRVYQDQATKLFHAVIDKVHGAGHATAVDAFEDAAAKAMGYASAAALRGRNAQVRQVRRVRQQAADAILGCMLRGPTAHMLDTLDTVPVDMLPDVINAFTRSLRKP